MSNQGQYFVLQLFTKTDFSDASLLQFKREKSASLTTKEYSAFLASKKIESADSSRLLNFFIEFDNGVLMPEKCDAYEPIRERFAKDDLTGPIRWLSQPGGAVFLKKTKGIKYVGRAENHRFAPIWQEGKLVKPKVAEPQFLGEVVLYLEVKALSRKPFDYLFGLLLQLGRVVNASYGFVVLDEEHSDKQAQISKLEKEKKLPGIFWINYFGPDYVSILGKERLDRISSESVKFVRENDFIFMTSEGASEKKGDFMAQSLGSLHLV